MYMHMYSAYESQDTLQKFNTHKPTSQHYLMSYGLIFPVFHRECPLTLLCVCVCRSEDNFVESVLSCYLYVGFGIEPWCLGSYEELF